MGRQRRNAEMELVWSTLFVGSVVYTLTLRRRQHTSAYVSIRQHTSTYVSIRQRIHTIKLQKVFRVLLTLTYADVC